ncbi:MAG: hypothetical protein A2018_03235 [Alphaproteobacteria bacterium GWF2_58_20]|nr:MAG: hypothetical protein A2018_03235 [Alphaproteobacteria bacterium GWF2_58_20]
MFWTDARVRRLKELWTKGKSASEIAEAIGGLTRNAVIGKAHRLGLSGRVSPIKGKAEDGKVSKKPASPSGKSAKPAQKKVAVKTGDAAKDKKPLADSAKSAKKPVAPKTKADKSPSVKVKTPELPVQANEVQEPPVVVVEVEKPVKAKKGKPQGKVVSILDLSERMCRWPFGDPKNDGFGFCGHPTMENLPYCEEHARLAYQTMQPGGGKKK